MIYSFFFNDTATTEIYTLSLHDALPICEDLCASSPARRARPISPASRGSAPLRRAGGRRLPRRAEPTPAGRCRSEEHTSELQSRQYFVCRLLLEKIYHINSAIPKLLGIM